MPFVPTFSKKKSFAVLKNVTNTEASNPRPSLLEKPVEKPIVIAENKDTFPEISITEREIDDICNLKTGSQDGFSPSVQCKILSTSLNDAKESLTPEEDCDDKLPSAKENCDEVVTTSLTNSQYDRLFDSVVDKAVKGEFNTPSLNCSPAEASQIANEVFTKHVQNNISPGQKKTNNEITPDVSPSDPVNKPVVLPKPKKEKKKVNETAKRTSLGGKIDKEKKEKTKKRKSGENEFKGPKKAKEVGEIEGKKKQKEKKHPKPEACKKTVKKDPSQEEQTDKAVAANTKWVQCCHCNKWRLLPETTDLATLDDDWMCELNEDLRFKSCFVPEDDWDQNSQESIVYADFAPGMFVWAKMSGYPLWPAIVDFDPDLNLFCEKDNFGEVSHYHVTFLDDNVSRAWVNTSSIEKLMEEPRSKLNNRFSNKFRIDIESAYNQAVTGLELPINERLQKYGFINRYNKKEHIKWTKGKRDRKSKKRSTGIRITPKNSQEKKMRFSQDDENIDESPTDETMIQHKVKMTSSQNSEVKLMVESEPVESADQAIHTQNSLHIDEDEENDDDDCDGNFEPPLSQVRRKPTNGSSQESFELEF